MKEAMGKWGGGGRGSRLLQSVSGVFFLTIDYPHQLIQRSWQYGLVSRFILPQGHSGNDKKGKKPAIK